MTVIWRITVWHEGLEGSEGFGIWIIWSATPQHIFFFFWWFFQCMSAWPSCRSVPARLQLKPSLTHQRKKGPGAQEQSDASLQKRPTKSGSLCAFWSQLLPMWPTWRRRWKFRICLRYSKICHRKSCHRKYDGNIWKYVKMCWGDRQLDKFRGNRLKYRELHYLSFGCFRWLEGSTDVEPILKQFPGPM
jgi:hypothetical protein